jgi:hypothetical protein
MVDAGICVNVLLFLIKTLWLFNVFSFYEQRALDGAGWLPQLCHAGDHEAAVVVRLDMNTGG